MGISQGLSPIVLFAGFTDSYLFSTIDDYTQWLEETDYNPQRIELIPKDMVHDNRGGLKGWLRTTWFPYTDQLPDSRKEEFLESIVERYLTRHPVDSKGRTHVKMVRLEVEAFV